MNRPSECVQIGNHWVPAKYVRCYIDGKPKGEKEEVEEPVLVELSEEVKQAISPDSYKHMIGKKVANIEAIKACLKNGINTQDAIRAHTKICQGTICIRLANMVDCGEATVDKNVKPWAYFLTEEQKA